MVVLKIYQQSSKLALLTVALLFTARTQGCLPDQPCKGGLEVYYNELEVKCNDDVDDDLVIEPPSLELPVSNDFIDTAASVDNAEDTYVLLIMVDADAPSPDYCPNRYWLHWMAQAKIEDGAVKVEYHLIEYAPPSPPSGSGVHRYQLLLYDVEDEFPQGSLPGIRSGFDLEKFRVDNGLGDLLASFQFTVEV